MGEIGLPPCLGDGRDRGFSALPIYIGSHDSCPGPPEGEGRGTTDPCTGTGEDYSLTLEIVIYSTLPQEAVSLALERPRLVARIFGLHVHQISWPEAERRALSIIHVSHALTAR